MDFQEFKEGGALEVEYVGESLDLYAFGVLHQNMQYIIDKVAFRLLSQEGLLEPSQRRVRYLSQRFSHDYPRFVKARVQEIRVGSLTEVIVLSIATALADPSVMAVLQNLSANVIWAIAESGVRGIRKRAFSPPGAYLRKQRDPFEIGPNLRDIMLAIAENTSSRESQIKFRYRTSNNETMEVAIIIKNH